MDGCIMIEIGGLGSIPEQRGRVEEEKPAAARGQRTLRLEDDADVPAASLLSSQRSPAEGDHTE